MKLGLGTVQFGMDYGISNAHGITPLEEVKKILQFASQYDIEVLDTASAYSKSEEVLGQALPTDHAFRIITKSPPFNKPFIDADDVRHLIDSFSNSLTKLRQNTVAGLLLHHAGALLTEDGHHLYEAMDELKATGKAMKIGVSAYDQWTLETILEKFPLDLVQVPVSILDQRLIHTGFLKTLKENGIEIHARSIFLQGLLLMNPTRLSAYFDPIKPHLQRFHAILQEKDLTPIQAALTFVADQPEIDIALCGVNNIEQLKEIEDSASGQKIAADWLAEYRVDDVRFLNPALWKID